MGALDAHRALIALALRQGATAGGVEGGADEVAGPVPWTLPALRRRWNAAKAEAAPWWAELQGGVQPGSTPLARARAGFFDSRSGQRKGRRVAFPRFHKRGARRSFGVTTGAFGVLGQGRVEPGHR
jgi:putative transposase